MDHHNCLFENMNFEKCLVGVPEHFIYWSLKERLKVDGRNYDGRVTWVSGADTGFRKGGGGSG